MNNLPNWVTRIANLWVIIGVALTALAASVGINVPDQLLGLFTQEVWNAILTAGLAVVSAFQIIKRVLIGIPSTTIKVLSNRQAILFALNPFRVQAA